MLFWGKRACGKLLNISSSNQHMRRYSRSRANCLPTVRMDRRNPTNCRRTPGHASKIGGYVPLPLNRRANSPNIKAVRMVQFIPIIMPIIRRAKGNSLMNPGSIRDRFAHHWPDGGDDTLAEPCPLTLWLYLDNDLHALITWNRH